MAVGSLAMKKPYGVLMFSKHSGPWGWGRAALVMSWLGMCMNNYVRYIRGPEAPSGLGWIDTLEWTVVLLFLGEQGPALICICDGHGR